MKTTNNEKRDWDMIELCLDGDIIDYIRKTAEEKNITIDDVINDMLRDAIDKYKTDPEFRAAIHEAAEKYKQENK